MNVQKDVCIIGGGVIGLSTAYFLGKAGKSVILLEKKEICAGASGACDEAIFLQSKKPGIALELAMESVEMYKTLPDELGYDIHFKNEGGIVLIEDDKQLAVMEGHVAKQRKSGLKVDVIDQRALRKMLPMVSHHIIAATYCTQDGQVDPLHLARGYVRCAKSKYGLEARRGVHPVEFKQTTNGWVVTVSDGSTIQCGAVVLAAGAWSPEVGKLVGIDIPISPRRGQLVVTEPIPRLGPITLSAGYIASKLDPTLLPDVGEYAKSVGLGFSLSQTCENNCMIGSTREAAGFDKTTSVRAISTILKQARTYFPVFDKVNVIRTIAGFRPATADGSPILGGVDGLPGFFLAAGHEGDGIALSPVTGKRVSEMVLGQTVSADLDALNLRRFNQ